MPIESASAFSQTLRNVTDIKLTALSKKRAAFGSTKEHLITSTDPQKTPSIQDRVRILLQGYKKLQNEGFVKGTDTIADGNSIDNLEQFLLMSEYDPSVGTNLLNAFENGLRKTLSMEEKKFEFGDLFGRLLTEWLVNAKHLPPGPVGEDSDTTMSTDEAFETVGRKEMQEQRKLFEEYVFTEKTTDDTAITKYLDNLFKPSDAKRQLNKIRMLVTDFARTLPKRIITAEALCDVIDGVIANNLLNNEKTETLRQFKKDEAVLNEVADVIMMHMSAYETWSWEEPISLDMRRQLNGKYRVFMDEGIIEALLVHHVGSEWTFHMKECFSQLFNSDAWLDGGDLPTKKELDERKFFLDESKAAGAYFSRYYDERNILQKRRSDSAKFFLSQMADSYEKPVDPYDEDYEDKKKSSTDAGFIKHSLLHLLSTELLINKAMHNKFTVLRSDFKWFGPSLPHTSIMAVLRYFGVPESWIGFFKAFLNTPIRFSSDGPDGLVRNRVRGVPISHTLSTFFGEMLLFVMDFAVNQKANGTFLYRIHDDFWLWSHDQTKVVDGWKAMQRFAQVVGIEFNEQKTGSKCIGEELSKELPEGDIQWGFLKLDDKSGRFLIDQDQVNEHIVELKRQLAACNSIFSWVQAWNKYYGGFFARNFGGAAQCFGREHVDMIIETLSRIQKDIFPEHSSVTDYLKSVIVERFFPGEKSIDIPQGWFYWPISMGGLGVLNPLVHQYAIRESLSSPQILIDDTLREERYEYEQKQRHWKTSRCKTIASYEIPSSIKEVYGNRSADKIPFPDFDEWIKNRELFSKPFYNLFLLLRGIGSERDPKSTPQLEAALRTVELRGGASTRARAPMYRGRLGTRGRGRGGAAAGSRKTKKQEITNDFDDLSNYWKWVVALYADEMVSSYGGLEVVKHGLLPVGMVEAFRSMRVSWEQ
ncbi:hypothetical protein BJ508DRAFT_82921 [Ascobolus immersus RN42]|uniref:Reverse transcriptase domain-containing protein n=1 Tax=Ascobolus immersus RN42 TaxID=1160509 RepID=A0A3N4IDA3_ASCIM|nr:hypothetical protein BJ508DRAFT_82921 [Ascobolus immersus RN42]